MCEGAEKESEGGSEECVRERGRRVRGSEECVRERRRRVREGVKSV